MTGPPRPIACGAEVLGRVGGQVRGDQAAQLAGRVSTAAPSRRPARPGMAQQAPCPRGCLRDLISCGERACEVLGLQCRLGLCGGGSGCAQRLVRAGCDVRRVS